MSALNPFYASTRFADKKLHLGISGSVAAYKILDLLRSFIKLQIRVSATLTEGAQRFISPLLVRSLGAKPVYGNLFENVEELFAHLEPGAGADAFLIAPASANILARLAAGFADDMLAAQCLAFNGPLALAPAMNPRMWANTATQNNVAILKDRGCRIVEPEKGETACGEVGRGRLADLQEIFLQTLSVLSGQDMRGMSVMVTMGPTREMWDGARFFSNASSGLMGSALATSAWLRGAKVYAICGPGVDIYLPAEVIRVDVSNAREMAEQARQIWPRVRLGMFCAAVADFAPQRPKNANDLKIRKTEYADSFEIVMERNPDILATCAKSRMVGQKVLGFAAEITKDMSSLTPLAREKLNKKGADLIAANRINAADGSFGAMESSMAVVDKNGLEEIWGPMSKADIAWELCSWLLRM